MFTVYGDKEIWQLQLDALRKILPNENFSRRPQVEINEATPDNEEKTEEWTDYSNLPQMDLSSVPKEFKFLTDHFEALRDKYSIKTGNVPAPRQS